MHKCNVDENLKCVDKLHLNFKLEIKVIYNEKFYLKCFTKYNLLSFTNSSRLTLSVNKKLPNSKSDYDDYDVPAASQSTKFSKSLYDDSDDDSISTADEEEVKFF